MVQIRKACLAALLGGVMALGVLTGCGGGSDSSSGGGSSTPAKAAKAMEVSIGDLKGSLQELTIPGQKKVANASVTVAGSKLYLLIDPAGGDKTIYAYDVKGATATADKAFGKDGKLTEPKNIIGYANDIGVNSGGELYISHQKYLSQYKDGKVSEGVDMGISNCRLAVPTAPLPAVVVWNGPQVKMGIVMEGKIAAEEFELMPPGMVNYKDITYVNLSSKNDPHVFIAGKLDSGLSTITNVDSKLQYGNVSDKKAPDAISWGIRMFTITNKYVVAFDSGEYLDVWSIDGKFIGKKELKKIFAEKPEAGFSSDCKGMCTDGDTIYLAVANGKSSDDTVLKVYALTLN